jgi:hypothetical protein
MSDNNTSLDNAIKSTKTLLELLEKCKDSRDVEGLQHIISKYKDNQSSFVDIYLSTSGYSENNSIAFFSKLLGVEVFESKFIFGPRVDFDQIPEIGFGKLV